MFKVPEKYRRITGPMRSDSSYGNNGQFLVRSKKRNLLVQASDELWEHVSVSSGTIPTWTEMAFIKNLFWDREDFVVQMHVPTDDHINQAATCLHLWRKAGTNDFCERPPASMVGITCQADMDAWNWAGLRRAGR